MQVHNNIIINSTLIQLRIGKGKIGMQVRNIDDIVFNEQSE